MSGGKGKGRGKGRKSRRGMLGSFKYPSARSSKKSKSMPRKVLEWIGGGIVIALMGFVLVLLVWRMFSPNYGVEHGEGSFEVVRVDEYEQPLPSDEDGGAEHVAAATVEIDGYEVGLQLTAEQLAGVRAGSEIRARYTRRPFRSGVRVVVEADDWYVEGVGQPPDWDTDTD